ncbi:T/G mismatch-specific endonuclease [Lentilactobacillus buchneri subsp. silagei]|uniref:very short patch repair endonuclease n=1 Tax=Lentilactobacillus buchneri TaxID=1581 RepID=UPI0012E57F69|nr:very short patch repair endonuclease [Lentilactobacillus buchneri]GED95950.1 T/G mismatch-specific endonuclease [Lentilactobacillus buchneri subsp. silagei]
MNRDTLTPEQRHKNMSAIRSKDTSIEVKLRKALWHHGYRYRKNYSKLPGKPDIAITKYRIAIFCDSEFFHGKDWDQLKLKLGQGKNSTYWIKKIQRNIQRDQENELALRWQEWTVLRFWGKDIIKHTDECVKAVDEAVYDQIINSQAQNDYYEQFDPYHDR